MIIVKVFGLREMEKVASSVLDSASSPIRLEILKLLKANVVIANIKQFVEVAEQELMAFQAILSIIVVIYMNQKNLKEII